jgi:ribosomal protein S18 acetylase RimI-like enzyme
VCIRIATTDEEILSCHPVMSHLRPDYSASEFLSCVRRQQGEGYELAMLVDQDRVVAVAGYRVGHNLAWGKYLYVDDLVTDVSRRSAGHGQSMMDWLVDSAGKQGCDELHLDSGVQRYGAHRFYLRYGLDITSHHFRLFVS